MWIVYNVENVRALRFKKPINVVEKSQGSRPIQEDITYHTTDAAMGVHKEIDLLLVIDTLMAYAVWGGLHVGAILAC